jgi:hypothetical protein
LRDSIAGSKTTATVPMIPSDFVSLGAQFAGNVE